MAVPLVGSKGEVLGLLGVDTLQDGGGLGVGCRQQGGEAGEGNSQGSRCNVVTLQ